MVAFPLEPSFAKALLMSAQPDLACSEEMLTIVSVLSAEDNGSLFVSGKGDNKERAASAKLRFASTTGDHMTMLEVFNAYTEAKDKKSQLLCAYMCVSLFG